MIDERHSDIERALTGIYSDGSLVKRTGASIFCKLRQTELIVSLYQPPHKSSNELTTIDQMTNLLKLS